MGALVGWAFGVGLGELATAAAVGEAVTEGLAGVSDGTGACVGNGSGCGRAAVVGCTVGVACDSTFDVGDTGMFDSVGVVSSQPIANNNTTAKTSDRGEMLRIVTC